MSSRHLMLGLAVLLSASGCRTAGVGDLAHPEPVVPEASLDAAEFVREHNRTAARIESFEAKPTISSTTGTRGAAHGSLAMERKQKFKLEMYGPMGRSKLADIGSNEEEFWFWLKDNKEKEYYICHYDELGASPLTGSLQPDWIVEALGLRIIPDEQVAGLNLRRGEEPGTVILTQRPENSGGKTITRETVFWENSKRIREHRIFSGEGAAKTLVAKASIKKYQKVPLPSHDTGEQGEVVLPLSLKLDWIQENLGLEVVLTEPRVNSFDSSRRAALFVDPQPSGYTRVDLAQRMGVASAVGGPTTIRESRTAPPAGVHLLEPTPLNANGTTQASTGPAPLTADLSETPIEPERVVTARPPQAPEADIVATDESGGTTGRRDRRFLGSRE